MKIGLIGKALSHSRSEFLHSSFGDYEYKLCSVEEQDLQKLISSDEYDGFNITIPYKETAMRLCDELSDTAKEIGCINVILKKDGKTIGDNTDCYGFIQACKKADITLTGKHVLILGNGATTKTVKYAAQQLGAKSIGIVSRSGELNYETVYREEQTQVIINTTPVGMYPNSSEKLVDLRKFDNLDAVFDVIYNPLMTSLVYQADLLGMNCANGLFMLAAQAKRSAELFTGADIADELCEKTAGALRRQMRNIVLIGMGGCGKSTVGASVAQKLGRKFYDTDALIEERTGKSIPDIFGSLGEEKFRALETEVCAEVGKMTGVVISTGGGAAVNPKNAYLLKQNSYIFYLYRSLDRLATVGRPMYDAPNSKERLFVQRRKAYENLCDYAVCNDSAPQAVAKIIYNHYL